MDFLQVLNLLPLASPSKFALLSIRRAISLPLAFVTVFDSAQSSVRRYLRTHRLQNSAARCSVLSHSEASQEAPPRRLPSLCLDLVYSLDVWRHSVEVDVKL